MSPADMPGEQHTTDDDAAARHRRKRFRTIMWFIGAGWLIAGLVSALR